jgi:hypothetical protein
MMDDLVFDRDLMDRTGLYTTIIPDLLFATIQPHVSGLYLSDKLSESKDKS